MFQNNTATHPAAAPNQCGTTSSVITHTLLRNGKPSDASNYRSPWSDRLFAHPPPSLDAVPFRLITAGSMHWDRWIDGHVISSTASSSPLRRLARLCGWGSYPRERLKRQRKPISAMTFVSVPLSWHTAGGHKGSLAASHMDYRKRHRGGGDRKTDRQTVRWRLRLLNRQQIHLTAGSQREGNSVYKSF